MAARSFRADHLAGCVAGALLILAPSSAEALCPERITIERGDTLSSIAASCGLNVDQLRARNPGISAMHLQPGTFLAVPRTGPTPQLPIGGNIDILPQLVPSEPQPGTGTTVILPPQQPPVPRQHILRGFNDQIGQPSLPAGQLPLFP